MRNQYAGVFGNRINRGDGTGRKFVEKVLCFLLKIYYGVQIPDASFKPRQVGTNSVNIRKIKKLDVGH